MRMMMILTYYLRISTYVTSKAWGWWALRCVHGAGFRRRWAMRRVIMLDNVSLQCFIILLPSAAQRMQYIHIARSSEVIYEILSFTNLMLMEITLLPDFQLSLCRCLPLRRAVHIRSHDAHVDNILPTRSMPLHAWPHWSITIPMSAEWAQATFDRWKVWCQMLLTMISWEAWLLLSCATSTTSTRREAWRRRF